MSRTADEKSLRAKRNRSVTAANAAVSAPIGAANQPSLAMSSNVEVTGLRGFSRRSG